MGRPAAIEAPPLDTANVKRSGVPEAQAKKLWLLCLLLFELFGRTPLAFLSKHEISRAREELGAQSVQEACTHVLSFPGCSSGRFSRESWGEKDKRPRLNPLRVRSSVANPCRELCVVELEAHSAERSVVCETN